MKNKIIGIYKITNPKGKIYIGKSINIEKRKKDYKSLNNSVGPRIFNSIKKYGWEFHNFEIIEIINNPDNLFLLERETFWKIYYLNSFDNNWDKVLFCELYDQRSGPRSEYIKNIISNTKSKLNFKELDTSIKEKEVKSKLGGNSRKPICQYDLKGNFIFKYDSAQQAGRCILGNKYKNYGNQIADCASGRQRTAWGYIWKYEVDNKNILQFDLENNLVKEWNNIKDIIKEFPKYGSSNIYKCLNNKIKYVYKFKWKYK